MKVSTEKIENCRVVLNIEAEPDETEKSLNQAYHRLVSKVAIPGFRKGKAPRLILERFLGKETIVNDALEQLTAELCSQAIEEHKIDAIAQPEIEIIQEDPLIFKATVPVSPTIEIGDYHQIRIPIEHAEATTEEEINEVIESLRNRQAFWEPRDGEITPEDMVTLNVKAECEGETFLDQEEEGYYLHPALNDTFPGFIEQVQGMKIGEEKEFSLILPDDYSEEKLAGKETLFKISVVEIKKKCLPELDDEFVKSLGRGIETVDLFREQIASDLKSMRKREARLKLEEKIVDAVIGLAQVDFPLVFVEEDIDYLLDNQKRQVEGSGLRWKDYLNLNNKKEEEIRNELRPLAERHITRLLVLNKIRELENIEIKLEEIDGEIERAIEEIGYFNPAQNLNALQSTLLNRKVVRHLIEIATAEKEAGPQEEGKEDEQGN